MDPRYKRLDDLLYPGGFIGASESLCCNQNRSISDDIRCDCPGTPLVSIANRVMYCYR